jgi:hypothetical protein
MPVPTRRPGAWWLRPWRSWQRAARGSCGSLYVCCLAACAAVAHRMLRPCPCGPVCGVTQIPWLAGQDESATGHHAHRGVAVDGAAVDLGLPPEPEPVVLGVVSALLACSSCLLALACAVVLLRPAVPCWGEFWAASGVCGAADAGAHPESHHQPPEMTKARHMAGPESWSGRIRFRRIRALQP